MKILAVADIHGSGTKELRDELDNSVIDLMLLCGDVTHVPAHLFEEERAVQEQKKSLEIILDSLSRINAKKRFLLYGNDDFDELKIKAKDVLEKYSFELLDYKISCIEDFVFIGMGGSNMTPFKTPYELSEEYIFNEGKKLFEQSPYGAKIVLVTHAPSYGILDSAPCLQDGKRVHVGSRSIRKLVETYKPLLHIHGHAHESTGIKKFRSTVVVNCASYTDSNIYSIIDINSENVASIYQCGLRDEENHPVNLYSVEF
jgi:Icc-related predicted phosphoesterase